jgi:hypothetical protein
MGSELSSSAGLAGGDNKEGWQAAASTIGASRNSDGTG